MAAVKTEFYFLAVDFWCITYRNRFDFCLVINIAAIYEDPYCTSAAFTLNGFDDQERNITFLKTDSQVLQLKFYVCSLSKLSILFIK